MLSIKNNALPHHNATKNPEGSITPLGPFQWKIEKISSHESFPKAGKP